MNNTSTPLPTAQEVSEALDLPLEEAEALLQRMQTASLPAAKQPARMTPIEVIVIVTIVLMLWAILSPVPGCK